MGVSPLQEVWLSTVPVTIGGVLFWIGGMGECMEQKVFTACRLRLSQWAALWNCIGGFGFFLGAVVLFWPDTAFLSSLVYTIGSVLFVMGSVAAIWLWRDEQFGLTFMSALNEFRSKSFSPTSGNRRRGHPQFSWRGFAFINLYCIISVVSVFNVFLEVFNYSMFPSLFSLTRVINEVLPFLLVCAVLVVHSAVVETPKAQPWHLLIIGARWLALAIGANAMTSFYILLFKPKDAGGIHPPPPDPPHRTISTFE